VASAQQSDYALLSAPPHTDHDREHHGRRRQILLPKGQGAVNLRELVCVSLLICGNCPAGKPRVWQTQGNSKRSSPRQRGLPRVCGGGVQASSLLPPFRGVTSNLAARDAREGWFLGLLVRPRRLGLLQWCFGSKLLMASLVQYPVLGQLQYRMTLLWL